MRIAVITDWFSELMGYSENTLPKALASLGHDVHVISSDAQPYFDYPLYKETYEPFIGAPLQPVGSKQHDGYVLHRLPHGRLGNRLRIRGLRRKLEELDPQIVQTFDPLTLSTLESAVMPASFRFFLECHLHASVFPPSRQSSLPLATRLKWKTYRLTLGRIIDRRTEMCYPISTDSADIVLRFFGISREKVKIVSLGVDTELFHPARDAQTIQARDALRTSLGIKSEELVCIYTGRFDPAKGPQILSLAVEAARKEGHMVKALMVGSGTADQVRSLARQEGTIVHPFVPYAQLPPFYRAADVGVWPRQESTSQLDALATGLPIILGSDVEVTERTDGTGMIYAQDDVDDLASKIAQLQDPELRHRFSVAAVEKALAKFSWVNIAKDRIRDYENALESG